MENQNKLIILAVAVVFVVGAVMYFVGSSRNTIAPIPYSTEAPPVPQQYLEFQGKEQKMRKLIAQDPQNPDLYARIGDLYFENQRFSQAIAEYEQAIGLNPGDIDSYNDLGLAYSYAGNLEKSLEAFNKGIDLDPSYQRIWLSYGYVSASNGIIMEAEVALQKAIELNPGNDVAIEAQRILDALASKGQQ